MKLRALKAAFPNTIPIMAGFFFIGITYGIYMRASGFPIIYPTIMSIIIFGGSLEFVAVEMLLSPFAPVSVFMMALLIQARHLFYGLSMLEKYKKTGFKKLYLVYGLCDESFSINYTANIPEGVDKSWFYFFVTMLNQSYWVIGATTGALIGSLFKFEIKGISFVMTAMFVVIFLDQWMKEKIHISAFIGIGASLICLLIFGPNSFMLPTMIVILAILAIFKKPFSRLEVEK